jgi:hypothetical protein
MITIPYENQIVGWGCKGLIQISQTTKKQSSVIHYHYLDLSRDDMMHQQDIPWLSEWFLVGYILAFLLILGNYARFESTFSIKSNNPA